MNFVFYSICMTFFYIYYGPCFSAVNPTWPYHIILFICLCSRFDSYFVVCSHMYSGFFVWFLTMMMLALENKLRMISFSLGIFRKSYEIFALYSLNVW